MANQVTKSNLFSESRNNILALLTSTNVVDPITTSAEYRKWIYSREPDAKADEFAGYPYLIVNPTDVDIGKKDEKKTSVDGKSKPVFWENEVEIVTSDRGYGSEDGKGLTHMDSISDDLVETFMNITNRKTLSNNSMKFSNATTTAVGTEVVADELVYRRSVMISFESKIQVSS